MRTIILKAEVTGTVWKIEVEVGAQVTADDSLMILESMKMEIPLLAPEAGRVVEIRVAENDAVAEGQIVAVLAAE